MLHKIILHNVPLTGSRVILLEQSPLHSRDKFTKRDNDVLTVGVNQVKTIPPQNFQIRHFFFSRF